MFLSNSHRVVTASSAGILFGSGMIISGMADPNKVIAFLDIFGDWDPSLAFVMAGALLVFSPFYHLIIKNRKTTLNGEPIPTKNESEVDNRLIWGAVIFGCGWGLLGLCPGPALTNLSSGDPVILIFISAMLIGIICANKYVSYKTKLSASNEV